MTTLTFCLRVDLAGPAFEGEAAGPMLGAILSALARRIELTPREFLHDWSPPIRDSSGNVCGRACFQGLEP